MAAAPGVLLDVPGCRLDQVEGEVEAVYPATAVGPGRRSGNTASRLSRASARIDTPRLAAEQQREQADG
jgi:hypothetical protein